MVLSPLKTHLFDQQLFATFAFINPALPPPYWKVFSVHTEDYISQFASNLNKLFLNFFFFLKREYL